MKAVVGFILGIGLCVAGWHLHDIGQENAAGFCLMFGYAIGVVSPFLED